MFAKRCFGFRLVSFIFLFFIFSGTCESLAGEKKALTWGTAPTTSGTFTYWVAAAKIFNEKIPEVNIMVRSTGASVHNARLLEKREVDMGAVDTRTLWEAIQGKGSFEGKPFSDLRLLYVNMTNAYQFVVSEKSGIKDIYGLEGKLFTPGILGSSAEKTAMDIFRILRVNAKLRHASYADALEAMKNEMIVGFGKYGVPDSSILDIGSVMKIRIISLNDNDIEKITKNVVGLRKTFVPSGIYPGVGEFKTVENEYCEYVRPDFPADLAYKIVKTLWENRAEIRRINAQFIGDRVTEVTLGIKVGYLHPGAIRFYRELGLTVPKNLIPPEMER